MSESKIESAVCRHAESRGCYVRKFSSPTNAGVPDRLFITPLGKVFFIEFKAPGKKPRALQLREARLIENNCTKVYFIDSERTGRDLIDILAPERRKLV